jgi:hypothetical protein
MSQAIEATLAERGSKYGASFEALATTIQKIKRDMHDSPNWESMSPDKKECLDLVATKIGRILHGDPEHHDSWHDINGYVKLVADTLTPTD